MDPKRGHASWVGVSSSNVEAVLWFERRGVGVLAVRFLRGGRPGGPVYEYVARRPGGTSEAVFHAMLQAPSKGKFRHRFLHPTEYEVVGPLAS